ncbi:MAG: hypothetical protein K8S62_01660 [Candidatus Sabulitectum sp.]|nr:hypothetical protein [Candidatus Sabulitectum sp.]
MPRKTLTRIPREQMKELSYQDCISLIEALQRGVRTIGILKAVNEFGEADSNPVNLSARSIGENMADGKDLQTSFQDAAPRLPDMIVRILENGVLNSVLDYALDDILIALEEQRSAEDISENLALLARKYESMSNSQICTGCFERDFNKLLARARTENAFEVILEQDGESFLHQKFISNKLIHIIEPTHSMVYKTFRNRLDSACRNGCQLEISNQVFQVTQENQFSYLLTSNGEDVLKVKFKEEKVSRE